MKKLIIFISIFFMFTINIFAYVDFGDLGQHGTYQFIDDFSDVKLLKNYVVWETDNELAIVTSDGDIYIYEYALTYYLGCRGDKCKDIVVYKYLKNSQGQYLFQSKSDKYAIRYNMNTNLMQKVWSTTEKVSYSQIFTNLKTYYSNNPIKEKYTNFDMPKRVLPSKFKSKLVPKGDILEDISKGLDGLLGGIGGYFNSLFSWLGDILESIKNIPNAIIDGLTSLLQSLFIPSDNFFKDIFTNFQNKFNDIFNIKSNFLDFDIRSHSIDDSNFTLVTQWGTFKIIDTSFIDKGIKVVRPYLRGFFGFLIAVYNFNQFATFIGVGSISSTSTLFKEDKKK